MTTRHHIRLDGKNYTVLRHPERTLEDGTLVPASVHIFVQWETVRPGDHFVHPQKIHRSTSIDPNGRIGRKVLALIKD